MTPSRRLVACASCGCYARVSDSTCPHCDAPLRQADGSVAPTKVAIFLGIAVLTTPLAAQTGCSGSVSGGVGGAGGAGGQGDSGVTTSSANSTTTTSTTTTSITSTTVSTYAAPATTTSGTCDNSGDCGDSTVGCIACAIAGACSDDYDACAADQGCIDYSTCAGSCADQACFEQCVADNPVGADIYNTLLVCVLCEQCYNDCDGASTGCM